MQVVHKLTRQSAKGLAWSSESVMYFDGTQDLCKAAAWQQREKIGHYASVIVLVEEIRRLEDILHIKIFPLWQWWKF